MKPYLLSIVAFILIVSVMAKLLPNGKLKPLLLGLIRLSCLGVMLAPVLSIMPERTEGVLLDESYLIYCSNALKDSYDNRIKKELCETYNEIVLVDTKWDQVLLKEIIVKFDMKGNIVHMNREDFIVRDLQKKYGVEVLYEIV